MTRARNSANLASQGNLFVDITNDRTGIGSVVPAQNLHVAGTAGFHADTTFVGDLYNTTWDRSANSLKFVDNARIRIGSSDDFQIYHDGSFSRIQNTSGDILIKNSASGRYLYLQSDIIMMQPPGGGDVIFDGRKDSFVRLYHDGSQKFETTAYGTNTTGTAVNDGLVVAGVATVTTMNVTGVLTYDDVTSVDSVGIVTARAGVDITGGHITLPDQASGVGKLKMGDGVDFQLYHNGTDSFIENRTGNLTFYINTNELAAKFVPNGAVELYHGMGSSAGSSKKFETTSSGATVTGNLFATNKFRGNDNVKLDLGTGNDFTIYHDGSHSYIDNDTGNLIIRSDGQGLKLLSEGNIILRDNDDSTNMIRCINAGQVELYHNGTKTFQTTSFGAEVIFTSGGGDEAIFKVLHSNLSQGIAFGYNTIAATGTNTNVDLRLESKGSGLVYAIDTLQAQAGVNIGSSVGRFDSSGLIKTAHGSESAPSHTFINDPDNGMYRPTTNTLGFVTGGTERLRIASDGQIKQTAASGDTIFTFKRSNTNTSGAVGVLNFAASDDHSVANIQVVGDGNNEGAHIVFKTTSAAASADPYNAATVERLRITSTGVVQIDQGTSGGNHFKIVNDEISLLAGVNGTGDTYAREAFFGTTRVDSGSLPFLRLAGQGGIKFCVDANSERLRIESNGTLTLKNNSGMMIDLQSSAGTGSAWIEFSDTDGTRKGYLGYGSGSSEKVYWVQQKNADMAIYSNNADRFNIQSNGTKVVRNGHLNILSTYIDFSGSISTPQTAAAIFRPADNNLAFSTANEERLRINSNGYVGINDNNPSNQLIVKTDGLDDNSYNFATVYRSGNNASGHTASGIRITSKADNSNGEDHTAYIQFDNRTASQNGAHGVAAYITLTAPDSQGTYGTGQFDFYCRNSAAYTFPNDPAVSSNFWMPSLFTIKSNGNVGINTNKPSRYLHIVGNDGATGATLGNSDTILHLDNKGVNGPIVEFTSDTNSAGRIQFTDTDGTNRGRVEYVHSDDSLRFHAGGADRVRIEDAPGIVATNVTNGDGDNNAAVALQNDYSAWGVIYKNDWIGNAQGWGTFWAGNSGALYRRVSSDNNPNEHVMVGSGSKRFTFDLDSGGHAYFDGSLSQNNYDYAEYFEWEDGNPSNEDRRGYSVFVNSNGKIEKATDSTNTSNIIGVISGTAAVIGDGAIYDWQGKWKVDEWGTLITEVVKQVTWRDDEGKRHSYDLDKVPSGITIPSHASYRQHKRRILNPNYDESKEYIPRDMRQEWDPVGLLGKVRVRDDSPKNPNWKFIKTINGKKLWLIR